MIAVLCNTDDTGSQQLTRRIADLYIQPPIPWLEAPRRPRPSRCRKEQGEAGG